MPAVKISAAIITFNEADNIERCIRSVQPVVDEVVVVDSLSTDDTKAICERLGARVVAQKFLGHVEQKNFAITQAENPIVLSLDADEELSEELQQSILKAKNDWKHDAYAMNRRNNYCGQWIYHSDWYPDRKLRLWDSRKGKWTGINPHDKYEVESGATVGFLDGDLLHYTVKDWEQHKAQTRKFGQIGAEMHKSSGFLFLLFKMIFSPPVRFCKMFFLKKGFLDGKAGFLISWMTSYEVWLKYSGAMRLKFIYK